MGLPMAENLIQAGYHVKGYDTEADAVRIAATRNILMADTVSDCVCDAQIIFTMLPNGAIVLDVLAQTLDSIEQPITLIDCSTIDIKDARKAHKLASESGHQFYDAPVSGGVNGAKNGTLTAMIGGDQHHLTKLAPYLKPLFSNTIYCGDAGAGQAAKICNNMLLATTMIGVGETFNLAKNLGLSASTLFDILSTSTGSCWSVNSYCPVPEVGPASPADNQYQPGFSGSMMLKDMKLSQSAAQAAQVATPLGSHSLELFQQYVDNGGGPDDFSGIIRFLQALEREQ